MARITPVAGESVVIKLGDGATPTEAFTAEIAMTDTKSVSFSAATTSDELVDTANLSAPAIIYRKVKSTDIKVDGSGKIAASDQKVWIDWQTAGGTKNIKITQTNTGANGGWCVTVPMVLTSLSFTAPRLESVQVQITLEQAGAPVVTANP